MRVYLDCKNIGYKIAKLNLLIPSRFFVSCAHDLVGTCSISYVPYMYRPPGEGLGEFQLVAYYSWLAVTLYERRINFSIRLSNGRGHTPVFLDLILPAYI